ncbi:MAG: hypothetical protein WCG06_06675 [Candidatus Omnitrophota bacterium]
MTDDSSFEFRCASLSDGGIGIDASVDEALTVGVAYRVEINLFDSKRRSAEPAGWYGLSRLVGRIPRGRSPVPARPGV